MPEAPSVGELVNSNKQLANALDRVSQRLDAIPDAMDRTYLRKDVAQEQGRRVDVQLTEIARLLGEESRARKAQGEDIRGEVEKLVIQIRWTVTGILVPTGLAIVGIVVSARGGAL